MIDRAISKLLLAQRKVGVVISALRKYRDEIDTREADDAAVSFPQTLKDAVAYCADALTALQTMAGEDPDVVAVAKHDIQAGRKVDTSPDGNAVPLRDRGDALPRNGVSAEEDTP